MMDADEAARKRITDAFNAARPLPGWSRDERFCVLEQQYEGGGYGCACLMYSDLRWTAGFNGKPLSSFNGHPLCPRLPEMHDVYDTAEAAMGAVDTVATALHHKKNLRA